MAHWEVILAGDERIYNPTDEGVMQLKVPILLYHSISENANPGFRRWAVSPRVFAEHMAYLHDQGYRPMTVSQFLQAVYSGSGGWMARPVALTFDDGLGDFYDNALPVLSKYGFTGTLYLATGYIGGTSRWLRSEGEGERRMLTWEHVAEISKFIECGTHSHTHPQLDILPPVTARDEIIRSKDVLEQRLGRKVSTFAYPYGYHSDAVRQMVIEAGYSSACAVKHAMSATTDDPFALSRLMITRDVGLAELQRLLSGQGLRVAPARENVRTKAWRLVRRASQRRRRDSVELSEV